MSQIVAAQVSTFGELSSLNKLWKAYKATKEGRGMTATYEVAQGSFEGRKGGPPEAFLQIEEQDRGYRPNLTFVRDPSAAFGMGEDAIAL